MSPEKSAVKNGRGVGMPLHRENLLRPIPSNKVRFTIGQQLFRAAIAPKTRGRNGGTVSPPFLRLPLVRAGKMAFDPVGARKRRYFW